MVLSVFMVQTLTTLLEPPPAIGGGGKGLMQPGQSHQPQANIAVFMFLVMLCTIEVVFIKLLALTSFYGETGSSSPDGPSVPSTSSTASPTAAAASDSPAATANSADRLQQEEADLANNNRPV